MRKLLGIIAAILLAVGAATALTMTAAKAATAPPTQLGTWISAENSGNYSTVSGQHPDVANNYEYWSNSGITFPASFFQTAYNDGATTPFLEVEPWDGTGACSGNFPQITAIGANGSAIQSQAKALGTAIANFGHPVVVTFAHEFNIGGQYPWANGDCGVTASQWISAWNAFVGDVRATAGGNAFFMWAPNVDPNGSDNVAAQYWPGASTVDMVGVDGYPAFCGCGGTFADIFGGTYSEIRGLSGESTIAQPKIFMSETDLSPLDGSGYESVSSFIADMCSSANGGDGFLEFEDGTPAMSSTQWSEADAALASDCPVSGGGGGGGVPAVASSGATNVSSSSATANGTVNPEGLDTHYQFDYGTTTSYGSSTASTDAGSGTSTLNESAGLSGLSASTTYHYRIEAMNSSGTSFGADEQFTTTSGGGGTSVALDSAAGGKAANTTSLSWTHTVGTGSNRALLVDVTVGTSSDSGCQLSATYDGIQMSEITVVHTDNQRAGALAVFGLASNPPSGSDTVHVSATHCAGGTPAALTGGSESFTGVNQSSPWASHAVAYGNSASSSVSLTSASSSDLVGEFVSSGSQVGTASSPVTAEFTENETNNTEAGNTAGGYAPGASGTVTGSWNLWSDWWGAAAVDIAHA